MGQPGARERFAAGREVESESSGEKAMAARPPRRALVQRFVPSSASFRCSKPPPDSCAPPGTSSHVALEAPYFPMRGRVATKDGIDFHFAVRAGRMVLRQPARISAAAADAADVAERPTGDDVARPRGLAEPSSGGVPSPQRLGYSGVILERLAQHTRTVLGVHEAWIAISPPGEQRTYTGVAAAGTDPGRDRQADGLAARRAGRARVIARDGARASPRSAVRGRARERREA